MNLLNGLAVADVGEIVRDAKVVSIKSRVSTISYLEDRNSWEGVASSFVPNQKFKFSSNDDQSGMSHVWRSMWNGFAEEKIQNEARLIVQNRKQKDNKSEETNFKEEMKDMKEEVKEE